MRSHRSKAPVALAGSLLIAHPSLRDPNFRHTVILLSTHDGDGAMGVVLNRPTGKRLGELGTDFALGPLAGVPVFQGGPVQTEQLVLCAWRVHPAQTELQIMFGLNPEKAAAVLTEPGMQLRAYFGYAGWTGGQLERELADNAWVVGPVTPDTLAAEADESMWRGVLGRINHEWKLLADEPDDPELN